MVSNNDPWVPFQEGQCFRESLNRALTPHGWCRRLFAICAGFKTVEGTRIECLETLQIRASIALKRWLTDFAVYVIRFQNGLFQCCWRG